SGGGSVSRILLVDADAFYVAVARLVDPAGAGKAALLIVGGAAERRGVVTSASYEARAYGVHSAMPMARAVRLCPNATVVPVPWEACARKSREIRDVLQRFTPAVEQASSDEFYVDLPGTEQPYRGEGLAGAARGCVVARAGARHRPRRGRARPRGQVDQPGRDVPAGPGGRRRPRGAAARPRRSCRGRPARRRVARAHRHSEAARRRFHHAAGEPHPPRPGPVRTGRLRSGARPASKAARRSTRAGPATWCRRVAAH